MTNKKLKALHVASPARKAKGVKNMAEEEEWEEEEEFEEEEW